ncbi:Uncharacterised protein [Mycobacterium tuberculosis]|uniref:Uncharacterized protein n=1 Tax=Mycobacterium tuberculosis TaxID=1773 RepID=A0A654TZA3_MYCTX|nr:Uncharacterised protein [Mycobacterium tuberculosis]
MRWAGSLIWLGTRQNIQVAWLRPGRSDLSCTETGTVATNGASGSTPCSSRKRRSAPAHNATTTSLMVTPNRSLTRLTSRMSSCVYAMLRSRPRGPLNGVGGAENGAAMVRPSRARSNVRTNVSTVAGTTVASRTGRDANPTSPLAAICSTLPPPVPRTGCGAGASGCRLHRWDSRFAPATPSTTAWWTLSITATVSLRAPPSMTHISHSGRSRSSGNPAMYPQISASSRRPPGAGIATRRRWCRI